MYSKYFNNDVELPSYSMIAGDKETLIFEVYDIEGNPYNLNDKTRVKALKWVLSPYGQIDNTVCELPGTPIDSNNVATDVETNRFAVLLSTSDTINLNSGLYLQQPIIVGEAQENRLGQGIITIYRAIQYQG